MDRGVFVSRVDADNTTLAELLTRYLKEITPLTGSQLWLMEI